MKGKEFLAIDPGLTGAIVRVDRFGNIVDRDIMPIDESVVIKKGKKTKKRGIDVHGFAHIMRKHSDVTLAYLEQVSAMPGQGVTSMFSFGRTYGMCEMALAANQIPYTLITPQKWMKIMHQGISKEHTPKNRSKMVLSRMYPKIDLRATERARTPHEGLMDAFLMAQYAVKMENHLG